MRRHRTHRQLVRYVIGGASTASIFWLVLIVQVEVFSVHYFIANNVAAFFIYPYSYLINKSYVFKDTRDKHLVLGSKFVVMRVFLFVLANATLVIGVEVFDAHYVYAGIYVAVQDALLGFIITKLFLFKPGSGALLR